MYDMCVRFLMRKFRVKLGDERKRYSKRIKDTSKNYDYYKLIIKIR